MNSSVNNENMKVTISTDRDFKVGDIVIHFKWTQDLPCNILKYMYEITGEAVHTESDESLIIYRSLLTKKIYARPRDMFLSKIDKSKYPDTTQRYRFQKVVLSCTETMNF